MHCDVASTATEGWARLEQAFSHGDAYDGLLLDWVLPDISGADLLKRIMADKRFESMSVMIFTERPDDLAYQLASQRPNNDIQLKEDLTLLAYRMKKFLTTYGEQSGMGWSAKRLQYNLEKPGGYILFVDDSPTMRAKYSDLLRNNGYQVQTASGMAEALEIIDQHVPQLAIIDYFMPGGNGDELCEKILSKPKSKDVTVVMHSQSKDVIEKALNAGAIDLIWKDDPVNIFLMRLSSIMRTLRAQQEEKQLDILLGATVELGVGVMLRTPNGYESLNTTMSKFATQCGGLESFIFAADEQMPRRIIDDQDVNRAFNIFSLDKGGSGDMVTLVQDVTQATEQEERLREAFERAEEATKAKSTFLANMSHEIRTPMNAILGFCYLLEKQDMSDIARGMTQKILNSGKSLLGIINDILDLSKIEASKLQIDAVPFLLSELLENIRSMLLSTTAGKPLELIIDNSLDNPDFLVGDPLRLHQVLMNLVSNAIKFTREGEIILRVYTEEMDPHGHSATLNFAVIDSGVGISEKKLTAIFEAFTQEDSSITRNFGGTGLGLAISKSLVDMMGGDLQVNSKVGEGSHFYFSLKFDLRKAIQTHIKEMQSLRILLAGVDREDAMFIGNMIESMGWHYQHCASVADSVELYQSAMQQPFDLVLLEWPHDPQSLDQDLSTIINQQHNPVPMMLAMHESHQPIEQSATEFIHASILKPVETSMLFNKIMQLMYKKMNLANAMIAAAEAGSRLQDVRILVVDDSDINRDVAERVLHDEGAIVTLAVDGKDAVDKVQSSICAFDIILMDIQMPVLDGLQACAQIRRNPKFADLPIIALTAGAMQSQREAAVAAGMNGFVSKPFDVDVLINLINRLCAGEAPDLSLSGNQQPVSMPNSEHEKPIDFSKGLKIWKKPDLHVRYLKKYREDYIDFLDRFDAIESEEQKARLAHKFKGASGSLGIDPLMYCSGVLEKALNEGRYNEQLFDEFSVVFERCMQEIYQFIDADAKVVNATDQPFELVEQDRFQVESLMRDLMAAMQQDDLDSVEELLLELEQILTADICQMVRHAVDDFDLELALNSLLELAGRFSVELRAGSESRRKSI